MIFTLYARPSSTPFCELSPSLMLSVQPQRRIILGSRKLNPLVYDLGWQANKMTYDTITEGLKMMLAKAQSSEFDDVARIADLLRTVDLPQFLAENPSGLPRAQALDMVLQSAGASLHFKEEQDVTSFARRAIEAWEQAPPKPKVT
jgi:hypothetical protein